MLATNDGAIVEIWDFEAILRKVQAGPVDDLNRVLAPESWSFRSFGAVSLPGGSALAFSPDGTLLAAVSPRGVSLWRPGDGRMQVEFPQPGKAVFDVVFDPSGRSFRIAVSGGLMIGNF